MADQQHAPGLLTGKRGLIIGGTSGLGLATARQVVAWGGTVLPASSNPDKVAALEDYGLTVTERVPIEAPPRSANRIYLETKRTRFGHLLSLLAEGGAEKKAEEKIPDGVKRN